MPFVSERSDDFIPQLRALFQNLRCADLMGDPIDLSSLEWVSPLTTLPLAASLHQKGRAVFGLSSYLQTVRFPHGVNEIRDLHEGQTYFPIVSFFTRPTTVLERLTYSFARLVLQSLGSVGNHIRNAWLYAVDELVTNIAEHSQSPLGWIQAQYYPTKGFLDAVVLDQGRGFKRTYEETHRVEYTDQQAIRLALEGRSVKDDVERGRGLRTTKALVTHSPLNGSFLIISGSCGYYAETKKQTWLNLGEWAWDGAIIAFRIRRVNKPVDIYPYVE